MHACANTACACTRVCYLRNPRVCGSLHACHTRTHDTRGPFKLWVICTVLPAQFSSFLQILVWYFQQKWLEGTQDGILLNHHSFNIPFFHHAVSQSQFHNGVGRDSFGTQDGTNFCVADTITLVLKKLLHSMVWGFPNEKH